MTDEDTKKRHRKTNLCLLYFVFIRGLEVELCRELDLARSAGGGPENLAKGTIRQHEICIRHRERRRVGDVLRLDSQLQVLRLADRKLLAERHIEIEERWTSEEVSAHVACLTRCRHKELRPLLGSEENVPPVLESNAAEIRRTVVTARGREHHLRDGARAGEHSERPA